MLARPRRGRVVRQVEVGPDFLEQLVVGVHTGEDPLRAARLYDHVAEWIVEARQQDGALAPVRQCNVDRLRVGRQELDAVVLERGNEAFSVVRHVVERRRRVVGVERVRRRQPEHQHGRPRDDTRREQYAVRRIGLADAA